MTDLVSYFPICRIITPSTHLASYLHPNPNEDRWRKLCPTRCANPLRRFWFHNSIVLRRQDWDLGVGKNLLMKTEGGIASVTNLTVHSRVEELQTMTTVKSMGCSSLLTAYCYQ